MNTQTVDLSVADLERMLSSRKTQLDSLRRKREGLLKELDTVQRQISELEGRRHGGTTEIMRERFRNRPRNEKSLRSHVFEILNAHDKGLTLQDLAAQILEAGYKTNSTNFKNVLYQCVYNTDRVRHDAQSGLYKLV